MELNVNGGDGNDTLTGGQGNTTVDGGTGTDTINALDGVVTVLLSTGDDTVNVNTDGVGVANAVFNSTRRIGAINIGAGGVATLTNGGAKVLTTRSLNITGTGKLDLTNNSLILDYTGASPIATIRSLIASGFNGGAWNGAGIVTSRGDAANFGLGYGEAPGVARAGHLAVKPSMARPWS